MEHAAPAPAITLALTAASDGAWLAATKEPVLATNDRAEFRELLGNSGTAVIVVCNPPATGVEIEAVAVVRRGRRDIRAVLINRPGDSGERLTALRAGFDEALDARIDPVELASRIHLLLDQVSGAAMTGRIRLGPSVWLDGDLRELVVRGKPVHLRPREYELLCALARDPGRTFSRQELLEAVGAEMRGGDLRSVDVHVTWLREKLDRAGGGAPEVVTVRGIGYRLESRLPNDSARR